MLTEAVTNFATFPPLGTVLVAMIGIGVAERSGLIGTALKRMVEVVPARAITAALVFTGVNASMAADAGFVVLVPLGAVLFLTLGRHPLAGLAAAFAGVSGGFSANLFLTSLDPLLSGMTDAAAKMVDPSYQVMPTANYYFMFVSVFLITAVGTHVTEKVVEPRLGRFQGRGQLDSGPDVLQAPTPRELRALWLALAGAVAVIGLCLAFTVPAQGVLRSGDGGLKPFYNSLITWMLLLFFVPGVIYGMVAGSIRSDRDVAVMCTETMGTMGSYVVLAFVAAQFVAYFSWSNLGIVTAVSGAQVLKSLGVSGLALLLGLVLIGGGINLLIGSASAKWAILAPVFVPMFMLLGVSPELVQVAYRVGDSMTNVISPLLPYYPMVIVFAQRYEPRLRLGTLVSLMLPYAIGLAIGWSLLMTAWVLLGIPLGPDAPLAYPGGKP
jgi:aminobenzoyl-glutamate transport protein